jgi:iron complex outermembrane receptor protein
MLLRKLAVLVWFYVAFVPLPVQAQQAVVVGQVYDAETEASLSGANVVLRDRTSGQVRYGTSADGSGAFRLSPVESGRYRLEVTFLGYGDEVRLLELSAADTARVSIGLSSAALPRDEIVITAGRVRAQLHPVTASNLTQRDIQERSGMQDLPVLLSDLPSVTHYSENGNGIGYSTLRMRGFGQRRIAVSINGIPQNDPEDFNVYWINFFDIQGAIQDIQVQRGAGASVYGPVGIGGAVNIVAKPYRPEPYARARVGYGSFNTQRYTVEANTGRVNDRYVAYGRFSRLLSDGYRDWSWSKYYRYFVGVSRYGNNSTLTVQSYGGPQNDGLAYYGIPKSANDDPDERRQNPGALEERPRYFEHRGPVEQFHQPHLELLHNWQIAPNTTLDQSLFWIKGEGYFDYRVNYRSPEFFRLPEDLHGLDSQVYRQPLLAALPAADVKMRGYLDQHQVGWLPKVTWTEGDQTLTIGAEARLHRSLRWGRIQEANDVIPDSLVGAGPDRRFYSFRGEKVIGSAFGKYLFRPVDRLVVQGDLQLTYRRYRHYDEAFFGRTFSVPYVFANPRVGVTVNPDRPVSGYFSAAFAQREPRLAQLYDADAAGAGAVPQFERRPNGAIDYDDPLIRPESLLDFELGTTVDRRRLRLSANLYWMEFWDEIIPSGAIDQLGKPQTGNADRTRHVGLEIEASARLLSGWDISANGTLSRNRLIDFVEYVTVDGSVEGIDRSGNPIAGFPERMARLRTSYRWNGWHIALNGEFSGEQYIDNSGATRPDGSPAPDRIVDAFTLVHGSLAYEPSDRSVMNGFRFQLKANNLLDRRVLRYGYMSASGARFFPAAARHYFASVSYRLGG